MSKCIYCGKPLTEVQIKRKNRFCCKSCSARWRNNNYVHPNLGKHWTEEQKQHLRDYWKQDVNGSRTKLSEYRKLNNPMHNQEVVNKMVKTKLKNGTLYDWKGARGGNGHISPAEQKVYLFLTSLGFIYNKAISTYKLRLLYPHKHYAISYKPDFYNKDLKLGIEIDGANHLRPQGIFLDNKKQEALVFYGIKLIHFQNDFVLHNFEQFKEKVLCLMQG